MKLVLDAIILYVVSTILLRIAGRKSIAQMTLAQTVVMVSIGTIIGNPIAKDGVLDASIATGVFVGSLILLEYLQFKFNFFERLITGKSRIVIENGIVNKESLKKLRLTVDQIEMRLRNQGISQMEDVKIATLEPNGILGYELKDEAKPLTSKELHKVLDQYFKGKQPKSSAKNSETNLFNELKEGSEKESPEYLQ
ncbi:DUF421 domain-containing protein [Neobacillus terrae]|uniref:DUF421 domain-containing protein n=1 Tax=Neobacillus terrae TaxID=3034837 RepID=UPI00140A6DC4|nr:DUF421 domain-containing protein [Neobacillus terrae]NHM33201.1 DUF421 domain-containing protein [Neobacillus terrae]